jgi:c-di-GMP-binding flagellar brake protein YcgR
MDIARTLRGMCESGAIVTATPRAGEKVFISRLLDIDPDAGHIVLACSDAKEANAALLAAGTAVFGCHYQSVHYAFSAGDAQLTQHAGQPAVRLAFPSSLLAQQRRVRPRFAVPESVPIRCAVTFGDTAFEARVVDISVEGVGSILYDPRIRLQPGTRLEGVKITYPQRAPIVVDLLVRHVKWQNLADGSYVARAGCSILGATQEIEDLIRMFITELGP